MDAVGVDQARKLTVEETVRQEVQSILKEADLDTVSERNIKDQIAKKLGNVEQYKDVIRVRLFTCNISGHMPGCIQLVLSLISCKCA